MDFDSPDVAKDFPGLAKALPDTTEYDEKDKSKKKKDKKDSKKDKEKGYAALADSPDEDVHEETKSPTKGIKIKGFKLSSKKKDKKESTSVKGVDKELHTKNMDTIQKEQHQKHGEKVGSSTSEDTSTAHSLEQEKSSLSSVRRPFDGQGYKNSRIGKISLKQRKSSDATEVVTENTGIHSASAEKRGLNIFLNAPVPLLLKKKDKDKESKKETGTNVGSKAKLKIKRGSKNSIEDITSSCDAAAAHSSPTNFQLPEDPEIISREIRLYEGKLEETHAQIKSGKKVSKKTEDQLWELQRALTQLKRKLRSINALSASFASASTNVPNPVSDQASAPEKRNSITSEKDKEPAQSSDESKSSKTLQDVSISSSEESASKTSAISEKGEVTSQSNSKIEDLKSDLVISPSDSFSQLDSKHEELEVAAEIHKNNLEVPLPEENPTPEDIYENEITQSLEGGIPAPPGKRENVDIIKRGRDLHVEETPDSTAQPSSVELASVTSELLLREESQVPDKSFSSRGDDDGDYVFLTIEPNKENLENNSLVLVGTGISEDKSERMKIPKIPSVLAPSIFDPFALAEFKTDEFIASENEALIQFNQTLQDEIVKEEEEISHLIEQIDELNKYKDESGVSGRMTRESSSSELAEIQDDEIFTLWQSARIENDTLNEQVLNLKTMVAYSRLEEFRLEMRVKYLKEMYYSNTENQRTEISDIK